MSGNRIPEPLTRQSLESARNEMRAQIAAGAKPFVVAPSDLIAVWRRNGVLPKEGNPPGLDIIESEPIKL